MDIPCTQRKTAVRHTSGWRAPTPDLLILDIMLPDGSGYDICERFRSTSDHPVIFLTGKGETCDKVEGLGHGGDYYLTKPYDPDELLAVADMLIKRHLQTKKKREQLTRIVKGSLVLDIPKFKATVNGAVLSLPQRNLRCFCCWCRARIRRCLPMSCMKKYGVRPLERISVPYGFTSRIYAGKSTRMMRMIMISFPYTGRGICSLRCAETKSSEI